MKKKILFVINTLGLAGAETALLNLLSRFPKEGYRIDLFVLMAQGELKNRIPAHVHLLNPSFSTEMIHSKEGRRDMKTRIVMSSLRGGSIFKNLPYLFTNGIRMAKNEDRRWENMAWKVLSDGAERIRTEYDLAVAFLEGGSAYYVADHVRAKKKAAVLHVDYKKAGYFPALDRSCYDKFDRIFSVSEEVRQSFLRAWPSCEEKTALLFNIIDQEAIRKAASEGAAFRDDFQGVRILTVGRLTPQKGYEFTIEVMAELKEKNLPVRWYVIGEGALRKALEQKILEKGLEGDFILLGAKENPYPYMKDCDIYAHLTRFEGKSIAIQEALTLGKAVIASDCSGNREQIQDKKDGILCEYDKSVCVRELTALIVDEGLRRSLGEAAGKIEYKGDEEINKLTKLMEE